VLNTEILGLVNRPFSQVRPSDVDIRVVLAPDMWSHDLLSFVYSYLAYLTPPSPLNTNTREDREHQLHSHP
jgi:hypothetical protein